MTPDQQRYELLPGQRFNRFTVVERGPRVPHRHLYLCRCDCGEQRLVVKADLIRGHQKSCGCWRREQTARLKLKHGHDRRGARTKLLRIWLNMRDRCTNSNNPFFHRYGGRGIRLCDRWQDFTAFAADVGEPPQGLTLDRINNDGDYEPANCRWATWKEQRHNRSDSRQ